MIYIILGTKGQFIKMFPLMELLDKNKIPYKFIHTCQHYHIIEKSIERLRTRKPDVYLTLKKEDLRNIWEMLLWIPKVLWNARKLSIKPQDYVLVHGNAESALLGLIIGKYFRAKIIHVEAGTRSGNLLEPFPEEIISILVDKFSDINFCPYQGDADNLKNRKFVFTTKGNTVFDSVKRALSIMPSKEVAEIIRSKYVVFTTLRKENLYIRKRRNAILNILEEFLGKGFKVVWPMHAVTAHELKTKGLLKRVGKLEKEYNLRVYPFFDYIDFMHLVGHSEF
ncbi:MAG: UDP-N-acetylglucosamine 2-epimerase, partial [Candidatus Levybacteria bacterium]|nr:UDP-N-acetylglucosamine 2-epimerase [Candidatus Levybacteria bacterium]